MFCYVMCFCLAVIKAYVFCLETVNASAHLSESASVLTY